MKRSRTGKTPLNQFKAIWTSQNDFSSLLFNLAETSKVKAIWPKRTVSYFSRFFTGFLVTPYYINNFYKLKYFWKSNDLNVVFYFDDVMG